MKMIIAISMLVSSMAFAQAGTTTAPTGPAGTTAPPTDAPTTMPTTGGTEMKKMTKSQAKAACKTEGKTGKDLKTCIKQKTM